MRIAMPVLTDLLRIRLSAIYNRFCDNENLTWQTSKLSTIMQIIKK